MKELEILRESYPDEIRVLIMLGGAYYESGRPKEAATCMRVVLKKKPAQELGSLVLFNSLLDLGRKSAAIAEARRYLALAESPEYTEVLADLEGPTKPNKARARTDGPVAAVCDRRKLHDQPEIKAPRIRENALRRGRAVT